MKTVVWSLSIWNSSQYLLKVETFQCRTTWRGSREFIDACYIRCVIYAWGCHQLLGCFQGKKPEKLSVMSKVKWEKSSKQSKKKRRPRIIFNKKKYILKKWSGKFKGVHTRSLHTYTHTHHSHTLIQNQRERRAKGI